MGEYINVKIIETGEKKTIPVPYGLRWKAYKGRIRWNQLLQCYEITQHQYDLELRMFKYRKIVGVLCVIGIAAAISIGFISG